MRKHFLIKEDGLYDEKDKLVMKNPKGFEVCMASYNYQKRIVVTLIQNKVLEGL